MSTQSPLRNGAYAAAEYALPQLGMLLIAPVLLHRLGAMQLGIWMLATAAVSSGALVSAGFGDAATRFVAMYRGRNDRRGIEQVLRGMLLVNLCVGSALSAALWFASPIVAAHMAHTDLTLARLCTLSLRIGCILLLVRSLDGVFTSVLRGLELYSSSSRITLVCRLCVLLCAAALSLLGYGVVSILQATLVVVILALIAQAIAVAHALDGVNLLPSADRATLSMLANYGCFTWMQVAAAILFSQADRVLVGILLGPAAVAYYSLCTQAAQPIHGLVSAGFHALFPNLSARAEHQPPAELRPTILRALRVNAALAAALALPLIFGSRMLLRVWVGPSIAAATWLPLSLLALSFGLLAMNVTAHFTLLAFGEVRRVTWFNLAAASVTLLLMFLLMPHCGLIGAASARLIYGPITLLLYPAVFRHLSASQAQTAASPLLQEAA